MDLVIILLQCYHVLGSAGYYEHPKYDDLTCLEVFRQLLDYYNSPVWLKFYDSVLRSKALSFSKRTDSRLGPYQIQAYTDVMASYDNCTAADYVMNDCTEQYNSSRHSLAPPNPPHSNLHEEHGSGTTGGPGYGNKRSTLPSSADTFRFANLAGNTAPYSNATPMGSGSTAGAGYGNKTGHFGHGKDSVVGKLVEKAGQVLHDEGLVERGRGKREEKGLEAVGD